MKQRLIFCIILFIFGNLRNEITGQTLVEDVELFRRLSAAERVEKILEEYRYNRYWRGLPLDMKLYKRIMILIGDAEESIPVLFEYLERTDMTPIVEGRIPLLFELLSQYDEFAFGTGNDYAFTIIEEIIWKEFHLLWRLLNQDDLNRLCTIYKQKIYKYSETYKVIDINAVWIEHKIEVITGKREYREAFGYQAFAEAMYEKYTELGCKDLRIDTKDLRGWDRAAEDNLRRRSVK